MAQREVWRKLGKTRIDTAFAAGDLAELAFDFAPIGLVVTENRMIRECNASFAGMFGYAREDLCDHSFEKLYPTHSEFVKIRDRGVDALRATNSYWDERVMARADGGLFWCRVRGHSLTPENPLGRAVWSFADLSEHRPYQPVTPREQEVIACLSEGLTSKEIARRLDISHRTVEVYRARLHKKFGVANTNALLTAMSGIPQERIVPVG